MSQNRSQGQSGTTGNGQHQNQTSLEQSLESASTTEPQEQTQAAPDQPTQNQTTEAQPEPRPDALTYTNVSGRMDEATDMDGNVRDHWKYMMGTVDELGCQTLRDRQAKALRILRDDGATYNIYGDSSNPSHTWGLDMVPLVLGSDEWGNIEAGLIERAELFNLLQRDLYGPRDLIRQGVIPPEALFCHRGFLRPCQGVHLPGHHDLILHSTDLIRNQQGEILVLGDRTQSPSGAGYALENRSVMSRVFPSLFRDSHVHRLSVFFQRLRAKLTSLSPDQNQPRIAVLTPGAHNETYFEHAYLANYLGFSLVQSDDLLVRNGFLWMKSLDGLTRVDVLLRRVDDWFCDPVELRGDSRLGIASLLEVVRAGNLVIANPLGSGVLENPVFLRYMPEIARHLLGRDLRIPSVETYWCGDASDLTYVLDHIPSLVIKPVFRQQNSRSVYGPELTPDGVQQMKRQIQDNPTQFVAQAVIDATYAPSFTGRALAPRPVILRSFAVANETSYLVMPGGLTRVGPGEDAFTIASQAGAQSKDTWVIASEPERIQTDDVVDEPVNREADLISLPSRVVENLFWMGRYAERAEASLRILRTAFMMLNGEEPISKLTQHQLLHAVSMITATPPQPTDGQTAEEALQSIIQNGTVLSSISSNLNFMLYCADETKELLSSDTFRVINDIRDALKMLDSSFSGSLSSAPEEALDPLVTALMALSGLIQESMIRGFGWRFMDMGRRLERCFQISTAIKSLLVPVLQDSDQSKLCEALLLSLEALISYRRRYRARVGVQASLDLVMLDNSNPRSLMYQVERLSEHIRAMPQVTTHLHELPVDQRKLLECETSLKLSSLSELSEVDAYSRDKLETRMTAICDQMIGLSDIIADKYFDHREDSQQLVLSNWEGI